MFLNAIKLFFIKKSLNKKLFNEKQSGFVNEFKTIGLLIEEVNLSKKQMIEDVLVANGIAKTDISILVYKQDAKVGDNIALPVFGIVDLQLNGNFNGIAVSAFIETNFDLLISYYDVESPILLSVTKQSKANFKVGFALENYFVNNMSIQAETADVATFSNELMKYLKILYKIE